LAVRFETRQSLQTDLSDCQRTLSSGCETTHRSTAHRQRQTVRADDDFVVGIVVGTAYADPTVQPSDVCMTATDSAHFGVFITSWRHGCRGDEE
jgi:hypothetical protein